MTSQLLQETLSIIQSERSDTFSKSFELAQSLLAEYGENNLAERLYNDIPIDCPGEIVADLFGILIWLTSDNGHSLMTATDRWLEQGNDLRKIRIALNLDTYPFLEDGRMYAVLSTLAARYPEISDTCNNLILSRKKLMGRK